MKTNTALSRICEGIDFCIENGADVITLSLGPASTVFDPDDPLQLSTKKAYDSNITVVVAAGNYGPGKMQAMAQAPWVVAVGAVDDNLKLLPDSGTGIDSIKGPDVVSYGTPSGLIDEDPKWRKFSPGTSFAAPKVAGVAAFARSCFKLMLLDLSDLQSGGWSIFSRPFRKPVIGVVDTGVDPSRLPPPSKLAQWDMQHGHTEFRISRGESVRRWYEQVVKALSDSGCLCQVNYGPDTVKRALKLMARPLQGYSGKETGAGLVYIDEAISYLSSFTPEQFYRLFCPEAIEKIGAEQVSRLNSQAGPLWNEGMVAALRTRFYDSQELCAAKVC